MKDKDIKKESKVISLERDVIEKEWVSEPENKALTPEQKKDYEKAKKEFKEFRKSTENKKYSVNIKAKKNLDDLIIFITTKAMWKFTQCLGIIETTKTLRSVEIKSGAIFLGIVEIEAIYYFLSQYEGTGLENAEMFYGILKPINDALGYVREDNEKASKLEQKVVAAEQGLELDTTIEKNSDSPK